jgi:hypothetical protein
MILQTKIKSYLKTKIKWYLKTKIKWYLVTVLQNPKKTDHQKLCDRIHKEVPLYVQVHFHVCKQTSEVTENTHEKGHKHKSSPLYECDGTSLGIRCIPVHEGIRRHFGE